MQLLNGVEEFSAALAGELRHGYGFIPLVGAGLSEPSGIPAVPELSRYLARCIYKALKAKWDPRTDAWPPLRNPGPEASVDFEAEIIAAFHSMCDRRGSSVSKPDVLLHQDAVGALADWRSALLFLSRWQFGSAQPRPVAPDGSIVDSFFLHIVAGQEPSLGHRMLACLAEVLRFRILLTTNFDSLLERAFEVAGNPLAVFDVHLNAGMPAAANVLGQHSIVKLHGGRYGLRGDFSLDAPPSFEDRLNFMGYLAGREIPEWAASAQFENTSHLIVAGVSGRDRRIQSLIESAKNAMPRLKIFWVSYSQKGFDDLKLRISNMEQESIQPYYLFRHTNLGLLFLEIYQRLAHCVPPTGLEFPAVWQLPTPAATPTSRLEIRTGGKSFQARKQELQEMINNMVAGKSGQRIIVVESKQNVRGVSSLCSSIFNDHSTERNSIWLDLDDFYGYNDFVVRLRLATARTAGYNESRPNLLSNKPSLFRNKLEDIMAGSRRPWILFLSARDAAGSNAGFTSQRKHAWQSRDELAFWELLDSIGGGRRPLCSVVLLRYEGALTRGERRHAVYSLDENCVRFSTQGVVNATLTWLEAMQKDEPDTAATRFVYALTLFRQARYPAALITWAVIWLNSASEDHDEWRSRKAEIWLRKLAEQGVIQYKIGGFVWMHTEVRELLRSALEVRFQQLPHKSEVHQSIADWYYKLYLASGDPLAVFESIYHRCECARAVSHISSTERGRGSYRRALREGAIREAVNLLKMTRNNILSFGHPESNRLSLFALQQSLRNFGTPHERDFVELSNSIMFDVAREAADFSTCLEMVSHRVAAVSIDVRVNPHNDEFPKLENGLRQAILMTALRSYDRATTQFEKVALRLGIHIGHWTDVPTVRRLAVQWAWEYRNREEVLRFGVRLLRRWMFLNMLKSQALYLASRQTEEHDEIRGVRLVEAKHCYHFCAEVIRFVPEQPDGFVEHDNSVLRSQLAITLASMDRFSEAFRRITESLSFLLNSPRRDDALARAVLDLRLAEIYIQRAGRVELFQEKRRAFLKRNELILLSGEKWEDSHRLVIALLHAADAALARVSRQLTEFHKNVWWWTLFYALKIKVWELWLSADVGHIPTGRVSHNHRSWMPLKLSPDDIMRQTIPMIRLDAFGLARVVESYSAMLRLRYLCRSKKIACGGNVAPECLKIGLAKLKVAFKTRTAFGSKCNLEQADEVAGYVRFVINNAQSCLRLYRAAGKQKRKKRVIDARSSVIDEQHTIVEHGLRHYS